MHPWSPTLRTAIATSRLNAPNIAAASRWCCRVAARLGAYQAGVYQALHEAGLEPDWVSGVSIGAINSALIAGNKPERRLAALCEFWDRITDRTIWPAYPDGDIFRQARNTMSA